jgi:hypothetical protein
MASTGIEAWRRHFEPVFQNNFYVETITKSDSTLYDDKGSAVSRILKGSSILALKTNSYLEKAPVVLKENTNIVYYMTFNNIQKPKSKMASGIKLKPQDFTSIRFEMNMSVRDLHKAIIDDIEYRTDLDYNLREYLSELLVYWSGMMTTSQAEVAKAYKKVTEGKAEVAKDFGEMLGAIACVTKGIIPGVKIPPDTKIRIPGAGNAPLADYFLINQNFNGGKLTISAKSGDTTNTLKPKDILTLLKNQNKISVWSSRDIYKFMQLVVDTPTVYFPFVGINFIMKKEILNSKALAAANNFKVSNFSEKKYEHALFANLYKLLGYNVITPPSIGELFYYTEKYVITKANEILNPTEIFEAATSGAVTYVKYSISDSKPQGEFTVLVSDAVKIDKKNIKWRSKNATNRAADKIGLQP